MLQRALTVSGGGGSIQCEQGSYVMTGNNLTTETVNLPFTPTRVVIWNETSKSDCFFAILDTANSLDMYFGNNGSALDGVASSDGVIVINTNSITLKNFSGAFVGDTRYWIAIKE